MSSNYDPLDIRSQERNREDNLRLAKIEAENWEANLKWIMSSRRGRQFIFQLLKMSGPRRDPFDPNAAIMGRKTGEQRLGIHIESIILLEFPELYVAMIREHTNGRDSNTSSGDGPKSN